MSSISRTFSISCPSCREPLGDPIEIKDCTKLLLRTFLENLSQTNIECHLCKDRIIQVFDKEKINSLVDKLDSIRTSVLNQPSNDNLKERMLHQAIKVGEYDIVTLLLNIGASPSALVEGISPLYRAYESNNFDISRLLIARRADVNVINKAGDKSPYIQDSSVNDFDKVGEELGRTLLMDALEDGKEELALLFMASGATIDIKDSLGNSVIHIAVASGLVRVVNVLLNRGCTLDETDITGKTPLHTAAGRASSEMLKLVLKNIKNKEIINSLWLNDFTPLWIAVRFAQLENVKILVEAGASLEIRYEGLNILEFAEAELHKSEEFYKSNLHKKNEGDKILSVKRGIVDYLKGKVTENRPDE